MSDDFEPTTEYPPTVWESDTEFEAPGPDVPAVGQLPRDVRPAVAGGHRGRTASAVHADLVLAGIASVN